MFNQNIISNKFDLTCQQCFLHNTLYYFNMMTCAMPDNPSLYFEINCQECKNCINARYSCSTVGCVGWLVEQEALSEGVGHARAYI
jgi:hypothetical protein